MAWRIEIGQQRKTVRWSRENPRREPLNNVQVHLKYNKYKNKLNMIQFIKQTSSKTKKQHNQPMIYIFHCAPTIFLLPFSHQWISFMCQRRHFTALRWVMCPSQIFYIVVNIEPLKEMRKLPRSERAKTVCLNMMFQLYGSDFWCERVNICGERESFFGKSFFLQLFVYLHIHSGIFFGNCLKRTGKAATMRSEFAKPLHTLFGKTLWFFPSSTNNKLFWWLWHVGR